MKWRKKLFENKLKERCSKPKDLSKALKSLALPNKFGGCIIGSLPENQIVKKIPNQFQKLLKSFYSNLARTLLKKLPKPPNQYIINSGSDYHRKLTISENFKLFPTTEDALFKLLKNIEITKVEGIDQISKCFKKGTQKPISEL